MPTFRWNRLLVLTGFLMVGLIAGCAPKAVPSRPAPVTPAPASPPAASPTSPAPALSALEREARARPNDAKALARYGSALAEAGETGAGIARLRRAVALDPKLTAAWHNLGLSAERQGWLDAAADAYARVVALKPDHAGEWIKLGYVLI